MDLRLSQIKRHVVAFTRGKGNIENPGLGFKGHSQSRTDKGIAAMYIDAFIFRIAAIAENKKIGIETDKVTVFQRGHTVL